MRGKKVVRLLAGRPARPADEAVHFSGLRRPLGLVLAGGGALGAWQAGFLEGLTRAGLRFDKVFGFSAGALTAAAYCLGRQAEILERWRSVDRARILRFSPRLSPLSLFSGVPIREAVASARDDEACRRALRCVLVVRSVRVADWAPVYSRFTPAGADGWDGPLAERLAASCAIPTIFPPVRIREEGTVRGYVDGVVPGREWLRLEFMAGCRDVVVVEMVRPDEVGVRRWLPFARYDQAGREICREQISRGVDSLRSLEPRPRVFRTHPANRLPFSMLAFKTACCSAAVDRGVCDAEAFLRDPEPHRVAADARAGDPAPGGLRGAEEASSAGSSVPDFS